MLTLGFISCSLSLYRHLSVSFSPLASLVLTFNLHLSVAVSFFRHLSASSSLCICLFLFRSIGLSRSHFHSVSFFLSPSTSFPSFCCKMWREGEQRAIERYKQIQKLYKKYKQIETAIETVMYFSPSLTYLWTQCSHEKSQPRYRLLRDRY